MMQRMQFRFSDTGTEQQIGPPFFGEIVQMRYTTQSGDTGGAIVAMLDVDQLDTGQGFTFLNHGLTPQFNRAPVQPTQHFDGFDTGAAQEAPIISSGERMRITRVATTGPAGVGRLWVWTKDRC